MKNCTYYIKCVVESGNECTFNLKNDKGHRQSWFKTYESAHRKLNDAIEFAKFMGYEVVEYKLYEKNGNVILVYKK